MKKISLFITLMVATICNAQEQQGIVKTRGRMVNGQLVSGQLLTGATITLSIGNPLVSGNQGTFSFNVPLGKNYSLVAVTKQGYTLADPDYTRRSFSYSSKNPFIIVLEDENQRKADINAATRKVRKTLTAQLEKREKEIETLKSQNRITENEYQERLQQLYDNQSKSEQLVKEMAERYAATDYDQLDEFNRHIQMYIEDGELQKADSMIRSKGGIERRVTEYHKLVAANKKQREELNAQESALKKNAAILQNSESAMKKDYEDLIQDLNHCHEIFMQQHKPDSALFFLRMLADLDTTNVVNTYNFAYSAWTRFLYEDALKYAQITIRNAEIQKNFNMIAHSENIIGLIYQKQNRLDESKKMYLRSLEHFDKLLFRFESTYYIHCKTMPTFNIGVIYQIQGNIQKAEEYYLKSLGEHKDLIRLDHRTYLWDYIWTEDKVGQFYTDIRNYEEAKKHLDIALSTISDSIAFPLKIERNANLYAEVRDHLGWLNFLNGDYSASITHYAYAIKYFEDLYSNDPDIFLDNLARIYYYTTMSYGNLDDIANYDMHLEKAIELYSLLQKKHLDWNQNNLIELQNRKVWRLLGNDRIEEALALAQATYDKDVSNEESLYCLAGCYNNLAVRYFKNNDIVNAHLSIDHAISLYPTEAIFYSNKGEYYLRQGKNKEALTMWKKVLELNPDFLKDYPDGTELSNGLKKLGLIK